MQLDYNLYALFETVGFIQALTLGTLLILVNRQKYKSTFFLGCFLFLFALETLPIIFESLNAFEPFPWLYRLPFDFFWLHFPIFYIYTHQVSIFADQKIKYWTLYPGIIAFFLQLYVFFLPYETKIYLTQSTWFDVYHILKNCYGLGIGVWTLILIYRNKKVVRDTFSTIESMELLWAFTFLIYNLIGSIIYTFLFNTIPESTFAKFFFVAYDLILIYWVSYHGVVQRNILSILDKDGHYHVVLDPTSIKNQTLKATDENDEVLMKRIDDYMVLNNAYTDTDLTIIDLAKKLQVHSKRISTVINSCRKQNFNTYVNNFRIEKAKKLLLQDELKNSGIESIGRQAGFKSKSAFYSAFKKFTGTSPTKFVNTQAST